MRKILIMICLALLLLASCTSNLQNNGVMIKESGESEETQARDAAGESNNAVATTMMAGYSGAILAGYATPYLEFSNDDYQKALRENKTIVLDFYANWCPECKAEQPEAMAAFNSLNNSNVIGFRVNYKDSQTDAFEVTLAKQFGVTFQHTKIIIRNSQRVLKSPESWDKDRYLSEIAMQS